MKITFLLIDGLNLIRRVYAAQPREDGTERVQSALESCTQSLRRALRECSPTHTACVFDSDEPGWRHALYPEYKAGREPMPDALHENLKLFETEFLTMGIPSLMVPAAEADDVIATLACKTAENDGRVIILSTDKAYCQLLYEHIILRDHFNKKSLDSAAVVEKFGVQPGQFVDFLALTGNSTNNIHGVPGVGPKTAARLLNDIGPLEDILAVGHTVRGKVGEMLYTHADDARLARKLVRLKTDLTLGVNLRDFRYIPPIAGGDGGKD